MESASPREDLPTCAGFCNHVLIHFVKDGSILFHHEDADRAILVRDTGGRRDTLVYQLVDEVLNDGVIWGVVAKGQDAGTIALAVLGLV